MRLNQIREKFRFSRSALDVYFGFIGRALGKEHLIFIAIKEDDKNKFTGLLEVFFSARLREQLSFIDYNFDAEETLGSMPRNKDISLLLISTHGEKDKDFISWIDNNSKSCRIKEVVSVTN